MTRLHQTLAKTLMTPRRVGSGDEDDVQGRRSSSSTSSSSSSSSSGEEEEEADDASLLRRGVDDDDARSNTLSWVACDRCTKWRRVPAAVAAALTDDTPWTCEMNPDKAWASCDVPQELTNEQIDALNDAGAGSSEEGSPVLQGGTGGGPLAGSVLLDEERLRRRRMPAVWQLIRDNVLTHRKRKAQSEDDVMICTCQPRYRGGDGCGPDCLNRLLCVECVDGFCPSEDACTNQAFSRKQYAALDVRRAGAKGFGLFAAQSIAAGQFIIEYIGEVLDEDEYLRRKDFYADAGARHYYFMNIGNGEVIDAARKGNPARFINHSCDPNCETQKWLSRGELAIGLFALRDIAQGEELTFDYNFERYGDKPIRCFCGAPTCRRYIGGGDRTAAAAAADAQGAQEPEQEEAPQPQVGDEWPPLMLGDGDMDWAARALLDWRVGVPWDPGREVGVLAKLERLCRARGVAWTAAVFHGEGSARALDEPADVATTVKPTPAGKPARPKRPPLVKLEHAAAVEAGAGAGAAATTHTSSSSQASAATTAKVPQQQGTGAAAPSPATQQEPAAGSSPPLATTAGTPTTSQLPVTEQAAAAAQQQQQQQQQPEAHSFDQRAELAGVAGAAARGGRVRPTYAPRRSEVDRRLDGLVGPSGRLRDASRPNIVNVLRMFNLCCNASGTAGGSGQRARLTDLSLLLDVVLKTSSATLRKEFVACGVLAQLHAVLTGGVARDAPVILRKALRALEGLPLDSPAVLHATRTAHGSLGDTLAQLAGHTDYDVRSRAAGLLKRYPPAPAAAAPEAKRRKRGGFSDLPAPPLPPPPVTAAATAAVAATARATPPHMPPLVPAPHMPGPAAAPLMPVPARTPTPPLPLPLPAALPVFAAPDRGRATGGPAPYSYRHSTALLTDAYRPGAPPPPPPLDAEELFELLAVPDGGRGPGPRPQSVAPPPQHPQHGLPSDVELLFAVGVYDMMDWGSTAAQSVAGAATSPRPMSPLRYPAGGEDDDGGARFSPTRPELVAEERSSLLPGAQVAFRRPPGPMGSTAKPPKHPHHPPIQQQQQQQQQQQIQQPPRHPPHQAPPAGAAATSEWTRPMPAPGEFPESWDEPDRGFERFVAEAIRYRLGKYVAQPDHPHRISPTDAAMLFRKLTGEVLEKERGAYEGRRAAGLFKLIERRKVEANMKEFVRLSIRRFHAAGGPAVVGSSAG